MIQTKAIPAWLVMVLLTGWTATVFANNIKVEHIALAPHESETDRAYVTFDVRWENSWRTDLNHDAAWLFLKFRAPGSNHWQHAYLSTQAVDHAVTDGVIEVGISSNQTHEALGVGAFLYHADANAGLMATATYSRVRLTWDFGISGYDWVMQEAVDVAVHAIEMVYIPEGPFYLGTGGNEDWTLTDGSWAETGVRAPYAILSEDAITLAPQRDALWAGAYIAESELPAAFPKGFSAFYAMKYQLTQGQYVEFLNSLTFAQQDTRAVGTPADETGALLHNGDHRHSIRVATPGMSPDIPAIYQAEAPDRGANYVSWADMAAYAQWAGLRPMTEFEYEKACRGPALPVPGEYAWGSAGAPVSGWAGFIGLDGSGTEVVDKTAAQLAAGAMNYSAFTPGGPIRVGVFATNHADRISSGASYWGVMELSGNLRERAVTVENVAGRNYRGTHGDGMLDALGRATISDWPGFDGTAVTQGTGAAHRGGSFTDAATRGRISDRSTMNDQHHDRKRYSGLRGVRTVAVP